MIEKLETLLGKSIESDEIKTLFKEWGVPYPKKTTSTANNSSLGDCKMKRDGYSLHFHIGYNSKYAKPIAAKKKGSYTGLLREIIFTSKYKGQLPFGLEVNMEATAITKILGEPEKVSFMNLETVTWRKYYKDKFEVIAYDTEIEKGKFIREVRISLTWDNDLNTMEDYTKAGL
jgi:hypothetical protein